MLSNAHKLLLRYSSHTAWTSLMLTWQLDTSEREIEREEGEVQTLDAKLKFGCMYKVKSSYKYCTCISARHFP